MTYYEPSTEGTRARFMENLLKTAAYAARYGVLLGFETMETPFYEHLRKGDAVRVRGEFPIYRFIRILATSQTRLATLCRLGKQRGGISRRRISRRQTQGCSGMSCSVPGIQPYVPAIRKLRAMGVGMFVLNFVCGRRGAGAVCPGRARLYRGEI